MSCFLQGCKKDDIAFSLHAHGQWCINVGGCGDCFLEVKIVFPLYVRVSTHTKAVNCTAKPKGHIEAELFLKSQKWNEIFFLNALVTCC